MTTKLKDNQSKLVLTRSVDSEIILFSYSLEVSVFSGDGVMVCRSYAVMDYIIPRVVCVLP